MERRRQGKQLVESEILAGTDVEGPRILLGDFNEWLRGITTRLLTEQFACVDIKADLGLRATYPGPLPLVHLDNIYFDDTLRLEGARLHGAARPSSPRTTCRSLQISASHGPKAARKTTQPQTEQDKASACATLKQGGRDTRPT